MTAIAKGKTQVRTSVTPAGWDTELLNIWGRYDRIRLPPTRFIPPCARPFSTACSRRASDSPSCSLPRSSSGAERPFARPSCGSNPNTWRNRSVRRGFVVGGISREEVLEVYAVREVIDGLAARLAAQGCLPTDLDHLAWLNRRLRKAAEQHDYRLMVELNIEFHEAVARASRNGCSCSSCGRSTTGCGDSATRPSRIAAGHRSAKEHDALLEALEQRDPTRRNESHAPTWHAPRGPDGHDAELARIVARDRRRCAPACSSRNGSAFPARGGRTTVAFTSFLVRQNPDATRGHHCGT